MFFVCCSFDIMPYVEANYCLAYTSRQPQLWQNSSWAERSGNILHETHLNQLDCVVRRLPISSFGQASVFACPTRIFSIPLDPALALVLLRGFEIDIDAGERGCRISPAVIETWFSHVFFSTTRICFTWKYRNCEKPEVEASTTNQPTGSIG